MKVDKFILFYLFIITPIWIILRFLCLYNIYVIVTTTDRYFSRHFLVRFLDVNLNLVEIFISYVS